MNTNFLKIVFVGWKVIFVAICFFLIYSIYSKNRCYCFLYFNTII